MSEKTKDDFMGRVPSYNGEVAEGAHDAVFGEITEDGPNYRAVCSHTRYPGRGLEHSINLSGLRSDGREQPS